MAEKRRHCSETKLINPFHQRPAGDFSWTVVSRAGNDSSIIHSLRLAPSYRFLCRLIVIHRPVSTPGPVSRRMPTTTEAVRRRGDPSALVLCWQRDLVMIQAKATWRSSRICCCDKDAEQRRHVSSTTATDSFSHTARRRRRRRRGWLAWTVIIRRS